MGRPHALHSVHRSLSPPRSTPRSKYLSVRRRQQHQRAGDAFPPRPCQRQTALRRQGAPQGRAASRAARGVFKPELRSSREAAATDSDNGVKGCRPVGGGGKAPRCGLRLCSPGPRPRPGLGCGKSAPHASAAAPAVATAFAAVPAAASATLPPPLRHPVVAGCPRRRPTFSPFRGSGASRGPGGVAGRSPAARPGLRLHGCCGSGPDPSLAPHSLHPPRPPRRGRS